MNTRTIRSGRYPLIVMLLVSAMTWVGCAGAKKKESESKEVTATPPQAVHLEIQDLQEAILKADTHLELGSEPEISREKISKKKKLEKAHKLRKREIPVVVNRLVDKWIAFFTGKDRERFQRFINRGAKYKKLVARILREYKVPADLYYLAMIESGYVTRAHSHAGAVGVWQFIRSTGKRYGLRADYYVDERRDVVRETRAAAEYLRDLHNIFGSWYLAMAAYNAGEGRIMGAIRRGNTRNFWKLARKGILPRETMNYVPKYLAAVIIGQDLASYGFTEHADGIFPEVKAVHVPPRIRLSTVARTAGISLKRLKEINPQIRRGVTPPGKGYRLWVPQQYAALVTQKYYKMARYQVKVPSRRVANSRSRVHRVRRGENLSLIAKKYRTSARKIRRANGLRNSRIRAGQRLRIPGGRRNVIVTRYKVRRGDNLYQISQKFGVSVRQIRRLNRLRHNRIVAGQSLKIAERRL